MWLNLTSDDINQLELTDYAERYLVDRLSVIPGVAKVRISGGKKKSLRIWLDPLALSQYKVSVTDIEKKLLEENVEIPAGRLESKYRDYTVKLDSGFRTVADFRNLVIKKGEGFSFVKLGDVSKIEIPALPIYKFKLANDGDGFVGEKINLIFVKYLFCKVRGSLKFFQFGATITNLLHFNQFFDVINYFIILLP